MAATSFFGGAFFGGEFFNTGSSDVFGRSGLGGDDVPRRVTKNPNRGWSREEWKERVKDNQDAVAQTLQDAYDRLTGKEAPISVLARVDAIVRPAAKRQQEAAPLRIDWQRMAQDYARATALLRLQEDERTLQAQIADEDEIIMLVMQ